VTLEAMRYSGPADMSLLGVVEFMGDSGPQLQCTSIYGRYLYFQRGVRRPMVGISGKNRSHWHLIDTNVEYLLTTMLNYIFSKFPLNCFIYIRK